MLTNNTISLSSFPCKLFSSLMLVKKKKLRQGGYIISSKRKKTSKNYEVALNCKASLHH